MLKRSIFLMLCLILASCETGHNYAPVTDITANDPIPQSGVHRVARGETLYEIAWRYGLDYRKLAQYNKIGEPYAVAVGQQIALQEVRRVPVAPGPEIQPQKTIIAAQMPAKQLKPITPVEPTVSLKKWIKPAAGKFANLFASSHKGINILGKAGDTIYAAATGKVVYCGNGLRGYGNLIILKHDSLTLSAYAHNSAIFVREGDWVLQGQKIAEMGNTGTDRVMLHFEIRRAGKPVDPVPLFG